MTFEEFSALPEDARSRAFQQLNPHDPPLLFHAVEAAFLKAHPECGPPAEVSVGTIGFGLNAIAVKVEPGNTKRVPKNFMGIPVAKLIRSKSGGWKNAR